MAITRCFAELQVNGVHFITAREILVAVNAVKTNFVRVKQMHRKSMIQREFLITLITIRKLVLRSNVIPTNCLHIGAWVGEVGVNGVSINNVVVHDTFNGGCKVTEPVLTLVWRVKHPG